MGVDLVSPLWEVCRGWAIILRQADLSPQDDGLVLDIQDELEF